MKIKQSFPTKELASLRAGETFHLNNFYYMVLRFGPHNQGYRRLDGRKHVVNLQTGEAFALPIETDINPVTITGHVS